MSNSVCDLSVDIYRLRFKLKDEQHLANILSTEVYLKIIGKEQWSEKFILKTVS